MELTFRLANQAPTCSRWTWRFRCSPQRIHARPRSWKCVSLGVFRSTKPRKPSGYRSAPFTPTGHSRGHGCIERWLTAMPTDRWHRLEQLFTETVEQPVGARADFLARVCGADARMRDEIASLVTAREQSEDFLSVPALDVFARQISREGW